MHVQHWNDILDYVKLNLGASKNLVEIKDEDLIDKFSNHVLPIFSRYSPMKKNINITQSNYIARGNYGTASKYRYKIPLEENDSIFDIFEVYNKSETENLNLDELGYIEASSNNMMDVAN